MSHIVAVDVHDVRFPTSRQFDGSDAMNPDPDYSAAYLVLRTDDPDAACRVRLGLHHRPGQRRPGRGDRGARPPRDRPVSGRDLFGSRWFRADADRRLAAALAGPGEGRHAHGHRRRDQRRLGSGRPPGGQAGLAADRGHEPRADRRPRRLPLSDRRPHPGRGAGHPARAAPGQGGAHRRRWSREGYPAYTTSPGWLGYSDEKLVRLAGQAVADGFRIIKLKVGGGPRGRPAAAHPGQALRSVPTSRSPWTPTSAGTSGMAIDWMRAARAGTASPGSRSRPFPDDILGHARDPAGHRARPRCPPVSTPRTGSCSSN